MLGWTETETDAAEQESAQRRGLLKAGIDCVVVVGFSAPERALPAAWQLDCTAQPGEPIITVLKPPTLGRQPLSLSGGVPGRWIPCWSERGEMWVPLQNPNGMLSALARLLLSSNE